MTPIGAFACRRSQKIPSGVVFSLEGLRMRMDSRANGLKFTIGPNILFCSWMELSFIQKMQFEEWLKREWTKVLMRAKLSKLSLCEEVTANWQELYITTRGVPEAVEAAYASQEPNTEQVTSRQPAKILFNPSGCTRSLLRSEIKVVTIQTVFE